MASKRSQVAAGVVVLVALLVAAVTQYLLRTGIPEGADASYAPEGDAPFLLTFGGDTLLGDGATKRIRKHGWGYVTDPIRPAMRGDYVLVNLEVPITTLRRADVAATERKWTYNLSMKGAQALVDLGIDGFGLANNHALDRGEAGLLDTIAAAEALGRDLIGVGRSRAEAEAPLLIDTPHGRVAVVAMTYAKKESQEASADQPGVLFISHAAIARGMELARSAGAEHVVAFTHFPGNYEPMGSYQRYWAGAFARAGYDLVVGHGPHIAHGVGRLEDTVVLYSVGNFVFNTPGRFAMKKTRGEGVLATAFLGPGGFERVELVCIQADNQKTKYQTRVCDQEESDHLFGRLGGLVRREGDVGVVTW
ncbi:MAG: CapA family protein [Deltaproteobacteria bacterium]|nr:CapA family protein [Deltaproteobacteria bacterium]